MAEIKFTLPGTETVTLSGQSIDKLVRAGDGDAALLYLYILKTRGQASSGDAAAAMGKSSGWIASAMAVLSRLGLIQLDGAANDGKGAGGVATAVPETPVEQARVYSFEEIKPALAAGSEFSLVVDEVQKCLGWHLSPDDMMRLFGIYDGLRIPPEVILLLVTHCKAESRPDKGGRSPTMRYIEKAAYSWEREGVVTLERAEEYLRAHEARRSVRGEIKSALKIWDREFSETESRYVDGWIANGFGAGAVGIAYDRTIVKTGDRTWKYLDSIMNSWHKKNLHTPEEIMEKDRLSGGRRAAESQNASDHKFGAPNPEEIDRMQRLLKKIKED